MPKWQRRRSPSCSNTRPACREMSVVGGPSIARGTPHRAAPHGGRRGAHESSRKSAGKQIRIFERRLRRPRRDPRSENRPAREDLITTELFKPLGMTTAGFGPPGTPGKIDQPWGHIIKNGRFEPSQFDNPPVMGPAGACIARSRIGESLSAFISIPNAKTQKFWLQPRSASSRRPARSAIMPEAGLLPNGRGVAERC